MANRPTHIDIRSQSRATLNTDRPLISPRLPTAGDIPPTLSPLDAFAAHSRLLAKQLSESADDEGRRMSRLPPMSIVETLAIQPNLDHFRATSGDDGARSPTASTPRSACKPEIATSDFRPMSVHPTLSEVHPVVYAPSPVPEEDSRGRRSVADHSDTGYFGARRDVSPGVIEQDMHPRHPPIQALPKHSNDSLRESGRPGRRHDAISAAQRALLPPRSPFATRAPSPRSSNSLESSDDDVFASARPPFAAALRERSGSGFSNATDSIVTMPSSIPRSPSVCSDASIGGPRLVRPTLNFSRPMSRQSVAGSTMSVVMDLPSRQASSDSQPSFIFTDDSVHTPVSMHGEDYTDAKDETAPATSYVYSRFALPRGKVLQRNSLIFQEPSASDRSHDASASGAYPPSPPSRPSTSSLQSDSSKYSSSLERPSFDRAVKSYDDGSNAPPRPSVALTDDLSSASVSSASTIKPKSVAPSAEWSADEHVSKAIDFHESGALTKSTYHLRLAARQNHPTGMLLYALACRHGWGMRANQREGVSWLRKAMDSAGLEVADDESNVKDGKVVDLLGCKTRRAQFALAIYELGVSHLNGWGIEQDKTLALRCFEIAGTWGDADALAEAGFCYAQGIGCKKDLTKSAHFYRQAEAKGISMVGNSWIYKSKYNNVSEPTKDAAPPSTTPEKAKTTKPRSKSRSRSLFGRKRPEIPLPPP